MTCVMKKTRSYSGKSKHILYMSIVSCVEAIELHFLLKIKNNLCLTVFDAMHTID